MTISLIIPAYNIEEYLPNCLDSCLGQDFKDYEIVLVDDGSTDSTPEICDAYAKKFDKITVVHQKNAGLSAARNTGIDHAKGEYIAFVDGDDCIGQVFLSRLYRTAKASSADLIICDFIEFSDAIPDTLSTPTSPITTDGKTAAIRLLVEQENRDIIACNKLYKKTLFKNIKYPVGLLHEDNLTTYKIFAAANRVSSISEALYYYRKRSGSIMAEQGLFSRLKLKERAAKEAIAYFKNDSDLKQAAEISLLLSRFAYLDNLAAGRLKDRALWQKTVEQIKKQEGSYRRNPYLTKKLRLYLNLLKAPSLYHVFRKIIN